MGAVYKAKFHGAAAAMAVLSVHFPGLTVEADGNEYWLSGEPLLLGQDVGTLQQHLDGFCRQANAVIALSDPDLAAIRHGRRVVVIDGSSRSEIVIPGMGHFEISSSTVTLGARGGGRAPRPLRDRVAEFCGVEPRFERAANILAEAGEDPVKLYMVMELIEKAHGGFPPKKKPVDRAAFCNRIGVEEGEWEALHRTARPYRHAEPHEDAGPVVTRRQARALVQHALKLWLEREVPY